MSTGWLSFMGLFTGVAVVLFGVIATSGPRARPVSFSGWGGIPTTAALIRGARVGVKARAGELNADFWSNPAIVDAIDHMLADGGRLEVVFGPHLDVRNKEFVARFGDNPSAVFRLSSDREMPHFLVIDDEYLCLEGEHAPLSDNREGVVIRSGLASRFSVGFRQLWDKAEDVDLCERIVSTPTDVLLREQSQLNLIAPGDGEDAFRPAEPEEAAALLEAVSERTCAMEHEVHES